ncbi:MAG: transcriptional repressor LexA [Desulfobacterales bacterium]
MPRQLTPTQQRLLDYLQRKIAADGQAPSLREAAADLRVSHAVVARTLKALESKECVRREGRYGRTVHLLNRAREVAALQRGRDVPIVGRIAAGLPMYAQAQWDGSVTLDAGIFRGQNLFALRVRGDSMQTAGILDGDMVICEPCQYARNGEIVAALIRGEEATVKRFFLRADHIELRPENSAYTPMRFGFGEVLVQGKVIGLLRTMER